MEITWYGQSCFRLRDYGRAVVTDPYNPEIGLRVPRVTATLVTVSHDHDDHNHVQALRGSPYVVAGPGEYEIGGIFVVGIATFHDDREGAERGRNTAYLDRIRRPHRLSPGRSRPHPEPGTDRAVQ